MRKYNFKEIKLENKIMSCKWESICPLRDLEKKGRIKNIWRLKYCDSEKNWENCRRYQMEEKGQEHSQYLLPDGSFLI